MTFASIAALAALTACSAFAPQQPELRFEVKCSYACIDDGMAVTAGHCVDRPEEVALVLQFDCDEPVLRRVPRIGEQVTIESRNSTRQSVVAGVNGTLLTLEGTGNLGESGSGVYGRDGALLGVVQRRRVGVTECATW